MTTMTPSPSTTKTPQSTPTPRIPKNRIPLVRAGFRAWIKANRVKKIGVTS